PNDRCDRLDEYFRSVVPFRRRFEPTFAPVLGVVAGKAKDLGRSRNRREQAGAVTRNDQAAIGPGKCPLDRGLTVISPTIAGFQEGHGVANEVVTTAAPGPSDGGEIDDTILDQRAQPLRAATSHEGYKLHVSSNQYPLKDIVARGMPRLYHGGGWPPTGHQHT